jgi:hypothetical protein
MGRKFVPGERRRVAALAAMLLSCSNPPTASSDAVPPGDATAGDGAADAPAMCAPPETLCGDDCRSLDTDPANCGACGHDCLGATCAAGLCEPTELGSVAQGTWRGLAVDATYVYWVQQADASVWRRPKDVSAPAVALVTPGALYAVRAPAQDDTYLYLTDFICCNSGGRVWRVSKMTGVLDLLGMWSSSGGPAMNLALDATTIYVGAVPDNMIYSFPKTGGSPLAVGSAPSVTSVAVDATDVYFTEGAGTFLARTPKGGGAATPIAMFLSGSLPMGLALTNTDVYVATTTSTGGAEMGGLYRVSKATDAVTDVAVGTGAGDVAADATGVAWVEYSAPGRVWVGDHTGTGGQLRATGYDRVIAVALDASYVYWMTAGDTMAAGHVYRVAR